MAYGYPSTFVLLSKQAVSNVGSVEFKSLITSNFSTYFIAVRNSIPVTTNTQIQMFFSTDNGGTYLNSAYRWMAIQQGPNLANGGVSASDSKILLMGANNSTSTTGVYADIYLFNMNSGTYTPSYIGTLVQPDASSGLLIREQSAGGNTGTTAITAVKLAQSSGNINSGTFYFYGVSEP